jgi:nucleotide-binding universal stress UspA family protein
MRYTHILAPTDFSDPANHALRYAFGEATAHHAKLTLLHVIHHHTETGVYYVQGDPEVRSGMDTVVGFPPEFDPATGGILPTPREPAPVTVRRDDTAEVLTRLRDLVPSSFAGSWEAQIVAGNPADAIIRVAQEHEVDLIVMGTHGRSGLAHVLLGSVAEKVLRHAPCPVLVTRERK